MFRWSFGAFGAMVALCSALAGAGFMPAFRAVIPAAGGGGAGADRPYVVIASSATAGAEGWREVVEALAAKHGAEVLAWEHDPGELEAALRAAVAAASNGPLLMGVVARPEEVDEDFVASLWTLGRRLDDDPYGDAIWGIVTGLDAADALRVARYDEPLAIEVGLAATEGDWLGHLVRGEGWSATQRGRHWVKTSGVTAVQSLDDGPPDTTRAIVEYLNTGEVDMMWTSGHATERVWQIGYSYPNGTLVSRQGRLLGIPLDRATTLPVHSPNPKVYYAPGNCLIGNLDGPDSMALGWIRTGGAMQFCGYMVKTWYGFMGWGVAENFLRRPGVYDFAEAVYLANQELLFGLLEEGVLTKDRDRQGHAWDRDAVVLYGDPGWEARIAPAEHARGPAYETAFRNIEDPEVQGRSAWEWEIVALHDYLPDPRRPVADLVPAAVRRSVDGALEVAGVEPDRASAVLTDDVLLVRLGGRMTQGERIRVRLRAAAGGDPPGTATERGKGKGP